jgi:hypothetical protein
MKLELKHLAAYLPYGLKVKLNQNRNYKVGSIYTMHTQLLHDFTLRPDAFKPILRPLSDLQNRDLDLWIEFGIEIDEMNTHYLIDALVGGTFYAKDIHFAFRVREALFKMHVDVFGLIDNGLAIDINTLES